MRSIFVSYFQHEPIVNCKQLLIVSMCALGFCFVWICVSRPRVFIGFIVLWSLFFVECKRWKCWTFYIFLLYLKRITESSQSSVEWRCQSFNSFFFVWESFRRAICEYFLKNEFFLQIKSKFNLRLYVHFQRQLPDTCQNLTHNNMCMYMYLKYRYKYAFDHFMLHDCWMCVLDNIQMLTNSFWLSLLGRQKEIEFHNNDKERHSFVCISKNSIINYLLLTFNWFCFRKLFVNNIQIRNNVVNTQLHHSVRVCVSVIFFYYFDTKRNDPLVINQVSTKRMQTLTMTYSVLINKLCIVRIFTSVYICIDEPVFGEENQNWGVKWHKPFLK